jgi:hypothetical protein
MSYVGLCVMMLQQSVWSDHTQKRTPAEIKEALRFFFTDEEIQMAIDHFKVNPLAGRLKPCGQHVDLSGGHISGVPFASCNRERNHEGPCAFLSQD